MELGPGLLETVYEVLLAHLLQEAGLTVKRQIPIPIQFRGIQFDEGFRADIIVEGRSFWTEIGRKRQQGAQEASSYLSEINREKSGIPSEFR